MDTILDALRVALASYLDELTLNEREEAQASSYINDLRRRREKLRVKITDSEAELARKEETVG